jgi:hypothetical protein
MLSGEGRGVAVTALVVWVEMLRGDERADVGALARALSDPRVRWFHDPKRRVGEAIGVALGSKGEPAWDVYAFFDSDAEWKEGPPAPRAWVHQLADVWADPARHRHGDDLEAELVALLADVALR